MVSVWAKNLSVQTTSANWLRIEFDATIYSFDFDLSNVKKSGLI